MSEDERTRQDEVSLWGLWGKLRDGWRAIALCVALGAAAAGSAILVTPPMYEASVVVQVGQVGRPGPQGEVLSIAVELPAIAAERVNVPMFQRKLADAIEDQDWLDDLRRATAGGTRALSARLLKATIGPGEPPLLEFRATGGSPEIAARRAEIAIGELTQIHAELAKPLLTKMQGDLALAKDKLAAAERQLDDLVKMVGAADHRDDRFTQLSLMTSLRLQKEADVFGMRQAILGLEAALLPPATRPARVLEPIFVRDRPVAPKKGLLLGLGTIGGLLAGLMWVLVADSWRRAKRRGVV